MMTTAANFWLTIVALELVLATAVAFAMYRFIPGMSRGLVIPIVVAAFVVFQYLLVALSIVVSRVLAGHGGRRHDALQAMRAALSEPLYFALAQLSMIGTRRELQRMVESRHPALQNASGLGSPECSGEGSGVQRPDSRPPLLLVHGLACNGGVWRWLLQRLTDEGFQRIHCLNLEPLRADIDELGHRLEREVLRLHAAHGGSPITIIAHSMGGLVARAALRGLNPATVRNVVTIATPHHGSSIARALNWSCTKQMCTDSRWLASLNRAQEGRLAVPLTSIASLDDNLVRPARSARLLGAGLQELRGLGHFGLLISRRALDSVVRAVKDTA